MRLERTRWRPFEEKLGGWAVAKSGYHQLIGGLIIPLFIGLQPSQIGGFPDFAGPSTVCVLGQWEKTGTILASAPGG
jgi:hypothetical protein